MRRLLVLGMVGFMALVASSMTEAQEARKGLDFRATDGAVLIAAEEIVAYQWDTHTVTLKPGVRKRLLAKLHRDLIHGPTFRVTISGMEIYQGTFMSLVSSAVAATPVILLDEPSLLPNRLSADQLRIGLGYPGEGVFKGKDPRGDERIKAALEASGKLLKKAATVAPVEFLKVLEERFKTRRSYTPAIEGPVPAAVKEEDLPALFNLLDSKEKCAAVMKAGSSFYAAEGSTVGHEAAILIDSFRTGKAYPIANTSTQHRVDREELRRWWQEREKKTK